jgi:Mn-dependent DtxR family transcriptional regulator
MTAEFQSHLDAAASSSDMLKRKSGRSATTILVLQALVDLFDETSGVTVHKVKDRTRMHFAVVKNKLAALEKRGWVSHSDRKYSITQAGRAALSDAARKLATA